MFSSPSLFAKQADAGWRRDFDRFVEDGLARVKVPGLGVAMIRKDRTLFAGGYGLADVKNRIPVTADSASVFLHHICVDSGHRRLGVGSALITRVEERALAGGIGEFAVDMWLLNDTAQAFFKSCGLETYRLFLRKQTVPGGGNTRPSISCCKQR
jgi:GNAT superfamily N-acetyltransferase